MSKLQPPSPSFSGLHVRARRGLAIALFTVLTALFVGAHGNKAEASANQYKYATGGTVGMIYSCDADKVSVYFNDTSGNLMFKGFLDADQWGRNYDAMVSLATAALLSQHKLGYTKAHYAPVNVCGTTMYRITAMSVSKD